MVRKDYMTIYIWHTGHQINETVSKCLHAGIKGSILKHTSFADNYENSPNKFVSIGYGILRGTEQVFRENEKAGVDYYEVDRGYINPHHYDGYYRISRNNLQAEYVDHNYPDDRLNKLNIKYAEWFDPKGKVIICPPTDYIEKYYGMTPGLWLENCIGIMQRYGHKYKIRHKTDTSPIDHDLQGAKLVMTFNSNVAVDATIKGIPVFSSRGITSRWNNGIFTNMQEDTLEPPKKEDVNKLLRIISYNQFTLKEIESGFAWAMVKIESITQDALDKINRL